MGKCANENPAQGMGFGRRLSGVPKSLGGTLGWGEEIRPRAVKRVCHSLARHKQGLPFATHPSATPRRLTSVPPDPPMNVSSRPNQFEPPAFVTYRTNGQRDRGEQGRRVSASRTTVLRDDARSYGPLSSADPCGSPLRVRLSIEWHDRPRAKVKILSRFLDH